MMAISSPAIWGQPAARPMNSAEQALISSHFCILSDSHIRTYSLLENESILYYYHMSFWRFGCISLDAFALMAGVLTVASNIPVVSSYMYYIRGIYLSFTPGLATRLLYIVYQHYILDYNLMRHDSLLSVPSPPQFALPKRTWNLQDPVCCSTHASNHR